MTLQRIIIDTDIGSDIDDAMALALAMRSPEIQLEGVTTVYGDVDLRAKMAKKMLQLGKREDVRVYAGINNPLLNNREIWMAGHEGIGLLTDEDVIEYDDQHAVDFIIETVMNNPGEITLVTIGPLTNIAASIVREPKVAENVKEIIMMGGVTRFGEMGPEMRLVEHNIVCDPEAASVVFRSGAPIVMVGLDVTLKVIITEEERRKLHETGDPMNMALSRMMKRWFEYNNEQHTYMHDPLTVALVLDRSLVKTKKMKVQVEYDHRPRTGQTLATLAEDGNVDVCLDVEQDRFIELILKRLITGIQV